MKKKKKQIRIHPALVFLILTFIVMIASSIGNLLNLEASYYTANAVTGELETTSVSILSLFNRTGLQYLVSNMLPNFINFAPLGAIIIGLMGVGVAYKSGFLTSVCKLIENNIPRKMITYIICLLGVLSAMLFDVGYVILIPLAAIMFITLERHPSAGICAAFAGLTFGYGASFVVNGLDGILITYTRSATKILDMSYNVNIWCNIIFMVIATLLISYVGMFVTEKFIIPRLGKYNFDETYDENRDLTSREKKGVILALSTISIIGLILIYCIIPGLPFSGLLLDLSQNNYVDQLFGSTSYFNQGIVFLASALLMIGGLIYGLRVKTIKDNRDFVDGMNYYLSELTSILVLIFFAAQFCFAFKKSNIGIFIAASLTELFGGLELSGIILVIVAFILIIVISFFLPAASTKWAILSPVMIPMFMQNSLSPEFAQALFRAADSSVKGMTPLFTCFVILIGFLQIYNQNKKDVITVTDAMSLMAPYTIVFTILWFLIVLMFYIIGIPLGIGGGVSL